MKNKHILSRKITFKSVLNIVKKRMFGKGELLSGDIVDVFSKKGHVASYSLIDQNETIPIPGVTPAALDSPDATIDWESANHDSFLDDLKAGLKTLRQKTKFHPVKVWYDGKWYTYLEFYEFLMSPPAKT